jgi:hypothetical protein
LRINRQDAKIAKNISNRRFLSSLAAFSLTFLGDLGVLAVRNPQF